MIHIHSNTSLFLSFLFKSFISSLQLQFFILTIFISTPHSKYCFKALLFLKIFNLNWNCILTFFFFWRKVLKTFSWFWQIRVLCTMLFLLFKFNLSWITVRLYICYVTEIIIKIICSGFIFRFKNLHLIWLQ